MRANRTKQKLYIILGLIFTASCDQGAQNDSGSGSYLYVVSGACYSGSNATFTNLTSSNIVYRIDSSTGEYVDTIADYYAAPSSPGDSPVSIANYDSDFVYVLVENTTTPSLRRVEKVKKEQDGDRQTFTNNTTALSAQLRSQFMLSNGDLLVAKSSAIEYITSGNARIGAPFISASGAPCNTSTTLIPKVLTLSNGKIVFIHAAAGQNRFGIYSTAGGTSCTTAQAAPNASSYPSSMVYDSGNSELIVAYAGNAATNDLNSLYAYSIDESTSAVSNPQKIYDASLYPATYPYLLYGISAMTFDASGEYLYIATAISTATTVVNYAIEKFRYDASQIGVDNTKVLTRVGSSPFFNHGTDTRCISSLMVAD